LATAQAYFRLNERLRKEVSCSLPQPRLHLDFLFETVSEFLFSHPRIQENATTIALTRD